MRISVVKYIGLLIMIFISCEREKEVKLVFNTQPAIQFIEILQYLEKNVTPVKDTLPYTPEMIKAHYLKNKKDLTLNKKRTSLLQLPVYQKLSEITAVYTDWLELKGEKGFDKIMLKDTFIIPCCIGSCMTKKDVLIRNRELLKA